MIKPAAQSGQRTVPMPPEHNALRGASAQVHPAKMLLLGLAASTLAACGSSGTQAQTGPLPQSNVATTQSPQPTPIALASAAALSQARSYESVLDDLSTDPRASLNALNTVATEPDLADEIGSLNHLRNARDRILGRTKVTSIRVDKIELANHGSLPMVEVSLCLDVTHVRATDASGKSIVPKNRRPYFLTHLTLVNRSYPSPTGWLVRNRIDREVDRCAV